MYLVNDPICGAFFYTMKSSNQIYASERKFSVESEYLPRIITSTALELSLALTSRGQKYDPEDDMKIKIH